MEFELLLVVLAQSVVHFGFELPVAGEDQLELEVELEWLVLVALKCRILKELMRAKMKSYN